MKKILILAIASAWALGCMAQQKLAYPSAPKGKAVDEYFGVKVPDPYRWLENDTSAATTKWVDAEKAVTNSYLGKIPFRKDLFNRLMSLANYEKYSVPFKKNGKYYYTYNSGLQNQNVYYVRDSPTGTPRVFLDPNKLSTDGTVALTELSFSNNGKYAAYQISRKGSDWQEIYVIDLATGKTLDDHILWAKFFSASWQGNGFYYSAYDAPEAGKELTSENLNHKVYYHLVGTPQSQDKLVYENKKYPKRFYSLFANEEETMLFLYESGAGAGNALYVKELTKPNSDFVLAADDMKYQYSVIDNIGSKIYLQTNCDAPNQKVMVTDVDHPNIKDWKTLIPETSNMLNSATIIDGKLFLTYSKDVSDHAYIYSLDGKLEREIKLPSYGSVTFTGRKDDKDCYYNFSSFTIPSIIYKYNVEQNTSTVYQQPKVKFNPNDYEAQQIFFKSKDGTRVPMFLVYKKGLKLNGNNPTLLYGYGGFNISLNPSFSSIRLPLLESGGIYVQVNLRGGGEYGEKWHLAGTKMQKQNVFDDFIAAAQYLIANKYTNKSKLAIMGGSNGGLLVGACMTQRPDLFKVAIPQVGVMDMLRYHKFTIGWNWSSDYGTSADSKEMFQYLKGYSPLHNLKPGVHYPATLVLTADHDDRVVPAHSFKFAATLQACNAGSNPALIRIESNAGHGGGMPLAKVLQEYTDIISFIMYNLGMKYISK